MFKVQLGVRINPLNGYLNLDCSPDPNVKDVVLADPFKLENLVDTNEIDEFLCNDTLDYLPLPARESALRHWTTRLAHGGKLIITGNDLREVCRLGHLGQMGVADLNQVVYGIGRKSFTAPQDIINIVMSTGQFDFDFSVYNNFVYTLVFKRK